MQDAVWCLASLALLGWVIYLKWENAELKKDKEQLAAGLRYAVKSMKHEVQTSSATSVSGKKPGWMK
jgi:hypothetical protein